ncbi:hypothetical protein C8F04DRAFT_1329346 [Mycena alexandri]|uniref:Uncharacterized protein n=1 Tax=Mycena alexandri TaxID=1745969 RepID=A0AAD6RYZ5_9AGAR|nr:hypothetical protein C8F04DRAFT_1329346 [Mycena alexandri]
MSDLFHASSFPVNIPSGRVCRPPVVASILSRQDLAKMASPRASPATPTAPERKREQTRIGLREYFLARTCMNACESGAHGSLPPEFEALFDDRPASQSQSAGLPLDTIVSRSLPSKPVSWPAEPKRKDSQTLAHEFRACVAALAILRGVSKSYPRLLAHAAVHALLRVDADRAGDFLLAFATEPTTFAKPPRMHPLTLDKTIKALLKMIPKTQGRQDRARSPKNAGILSLDVEIVSELSLRTALALYLTLLDQREFVPAAPFFEQQVRDFQLYKSLPTILHSSDPAAPSLTPHDRDYLHRLLAVLHVERIRPSDSLFADLCYRIHGVLSNIVNHPESDYVSQDVIEAQRRVADSTVGPETDPSNRFPYTDPDGAYTSAAPHEPREPLKPPFHSSLNHSRCMQGLTASPPSSLHAHTFALFWRRILTPSLAHHISLAHFISVLVAIFGSTRFSPPEDPVEAADDSFMPPSSLPTLQALLGVFLNDMRALLYDYSSSKIAATVDIEPESETRATPLDRDDCMEARVHQHYHAPCSPNNPDPRLRYPAHPLDFAAYPAPPVPPLFGPDAVLPPSKLGGGGSQRHRAELAARVLAYMMHERNPRLPPWQSSQMMQLLWRRTDVLQPVLEEKGLWDELWAGAAQAQREAEKRDSAARRLTGGPSLDDNVNHEEEWAVEERL